MDGLLSYRTKQKPFLKDSARNTSDRYNCDFTRKINERNMMLKTRLQIEIERVDVLAMTEVVAYFNKLSGRLERHDCSEEERKNGLILLRKISERVPFLNFSLDPA